MNYIKGENVSNVTYTINQKSIYVCKVHPYPSKMPTEKKILSIYMLTYYNEN